MQYYPQGVTGTSIFPNLQATYPGVLPEPSSTPLPLPYGGATSPASGGAAFYLESLFGVGGLVATPTALAIILNNLSQVYAGTATGPLTQATVDGMVAPPVNPATGQLPSEPNTYWFGEGLDIMPNGPAGQTWEKFGGLSGTSAVMERFLDGTIVVATFNAAQSGYFDQLQQIVTAALYSPPVASDSSTSTSVNTSIAIDVLNNVSDPNPDGALDPSSVTIVPGTGPSDGSASVNPSTGVVTYTPTVGFTGTDQFTYKVSDNFGLTSNVATVTIQVTASARSPTTTLLSRR